MRAARHHLSACAVVLRAAFALFVYALVHPGAAGRLCPQSGRVVPR